MKNTFERLVYLNYSKYFSKRNVIINTVFVKIVSFFKKMCYNGCEKGKKVKKGNISHIVTTNPNNY